MLFQLTAPWRVQTARTNVGSLAPKRMQTRVLVTVFGWMQNLGAVILLFVAWQLWGTAIGEHHAQTSLKSQFEAKVHSGRARPHELVSITSQGKPVQLIPSSARYGNPADGTAVAQLTIPKIGLDQVVVSGTSTDDLAKGPGHYVGTALPGQAGNVAIAGHRTTHGAPFNRLAELVVGDPIVLTTSWGERITYIVTQTPYPVSPSDVTVLDDFGDNRLTLTTCNPEFSAAQRLIVVAELQLSTGAPTPPVHKPTPYKLELTQVSVGWQWGELAPAAATTTLLIGLGLLNRRLARFYGRVGRWLILVPIWVTGLYLLFESLTNFLPASV
jgi:sortase A